jgi:hypothetical protein
MEEGCSCTRFFVDCEEAARLYEGALEAYLAGREEWGKTLAIYYLWHKRRVVEAATVDNA